MQHNTASGKRARHAQKTHAVDQQPPYVLSTRALWRRQHRHSTHRHSTQQRTNNQPGVDDRSPTKHDKTPWLCSPHPAHCPNTLASLLHRLAMTPACCRVLLTAASGHTARGEGAFTTSSKKVAAVNGSGTHTHKHKWLVAGTSSRQRLFSIQLPMMKPQNRS